MPERLTGRSVRRTIAANASDLLPLLDFAGLLLAGFLSIAATAAFLAPSISPFNTWHDLNRVVWIAAIVAPFILYDRRFATLAGAGHHGALLRSFAGRFLMALGVISPIAFAGRWLDDAPRGLLALWLGSAVLITAGGRVLLAQLLRRLTRQGALAETVAVIGAGIFADGLIPRLHKTTGLFGVFDDRSSRSGDFAHAPEATVESLIARASASPPQRPDRIVIALPGTAEPRLLSLVERLRPLGVPVELCAQNASLRPPPVVAYVGDWLPVTLLADRPIRRWGAVLKSTFDFTLGSIIMLLLLPVFACIALAIRLDSPGPIVFKQRRHGISNREFDIYKFRTMRSAPEISGTAIKQTVRGDSRITRVGHFLRKWSLDELPQVFNVLEGEMSLVGPRPHAVAMRTQQQLGFEITDVYPHRHRVKPGITGWAQVNGSRGATDTIEQLRRRIELDLYYVEHWSLLLDLKILCLTFKAVLRPTNAF